jgi:DNA-directed RNA polymerase sigma subunit (sigma70/sigma32)
MSALRETYRNRREQIAAALRDTKQTYEAIGAVFGISRERVHQIAKRYGLERRSQKPRHPDMLDKRCK